MQHAHDDHTPASQLSPGGRIGSQHLRESLSLAEDFGGLEEDTDRYGLLLLVKRAGKAAGFTPRMITLLDYYMSFTREQDWEEGARPIVYQSLARTALDLGVSERQVQRLERALFEAGALTWNDSGNHRRYGQRCPDTGSILFAFGVDLAPLASLRPDLDALLLEKKEHDRKWMNAKRQISWYRARIRACLAELDPDGAGEGAHDPETVRSLTGSYDAIAVQVRTHISLEQLHNLLEEHRELHARVEAAAAAHDRHPPPRSETLEEAQETGKGSSRDDAGVTHYRDTTQQPLNKFNTRSRQDKLAVRGFQESGSRVSEHKPGRAGQGASPKKPSSSTSPEPHQPSDQGSNISATGLQHISLKQALNAMSPRFRDHLPLAPRPMNWGDVVEAAYALKLDLGVSQGSWAKACVTLDRTGAAMCLLLTDRAAQREVNRVMKPGAYFNAMINRAEQGELRLHSAVFGILNQEERR